MKKIITAGIAVFFLASCVSLSTVYKNTNKPVELAKEDVTDAPLPDTEGGGETAAADTPVPKELKDINLRVLIHKTPYSITVTSDYPIIIQSHAKISPSDRVVVRLKDNYIFVNNNSISGKRVELASQGYLKLNDKKYRGAFAIVLADKKLMVINKIPLDEYLYGVLPSEVSPKWHKELLKAQAVAARSFAVYYRLNSKHTEYDLDSSVLSQVYKGMNIENENTNAAIDETSGEVVAYDGNVIQAFFHANSGGKTASSEEVWGGKLDYLKSVNDPYCNEGTHYKWNLKLQASAVADALYKNRINTGEIYDIKLISRTESGRVFLLKIYGSNGTFEIKGKDLRRYIGVDKLRSTNFSVKISEEGVFFEGYGWGHGVGFSQDGARGMAEKGRGYKEILKHYYSNCEVKQAKVR